MSTRSTHTRKRRRVSTSRTVDFLNAVNTPNLTPVNSSPPSRTARRSATKSGGRHVAHPDTIWDVPDTNDALVSPSRRVTPNVSTPRRSTRLITKLNSGATPNRQSPRSERKTSVQPGEENTENSDRDSLEPDDATDKLNWQSKTQESTDRVGSPQVVIWSDDHPGYSPEAAVSLSPWEYFEQLPRTEHPQALEVTNEDLYGDSGSDYKTAHTHTLEQSDKLSSPLHRPPSAQEEQGSPVSSADANTESRSSAPAQSAEADNLLDSTGIAQPENTAASSQQEPVDPSDDARSGDDSDDQTDMMAEHETWAPDMAEDESSWDCSTQRSVSPSDSDADDRRTPELEAERDSLLQVADSPVHEAGRDQNQSQDSLRDSSGLSSDASEDEANKLGAWLDKATEEDWNRLIQEASVMRKTTRSAMDRHFTTFNDLSTKLKDRFVSHRFDQRKCDALMNGMLAEGNLVLDEAFSRRNEADPHRPSSKELVNEFEARLLTTTVELMVTCLRSYTTMCDFYSGAYRCLRQVMELLTRLSERIYCLVSEGYIHCRSISHGLRRPLKRLCAALRKLGEAESPRPQPVSIQTNKYGRKWERAEENALLVGLQLYTGPNRYVEILKHFPQELRGRTVRSARDKARQLCNDFEKVNDTLQTVDGQRKWQWLLSVRQR
ncbi:hypothetical protein BDV25DRAFT_160605 [Aspergillus avenaceus]|uniref:Myb-like domain-containing protein n=1 Tax=Aspergillus avenaceus TaxID=36643 RepID=A0A5N6TM13_ASPAV|nr:hypothetical protein BDV25DRAFT_160605 [Aspergillus avenaceus]